MMDRLKDTRVVVLAASVVLRLLLVVYGQHQDATMDVKYTDVDYHVFTDAARFLAAGESPYARSTYRYSPLLAWLLTPNIYLAPVFGKILFITCDVASGLLVYVILRHRGQSCQGAGVACCLWLLNPLPMGVSSRGNAESILAALVLGTLLCLQAGHVIRAAVLYGLSVHMKIYPIAYVLPIALTLRTPGPPSPRGPAGRPWSKVAGFIGSFFSRQLLVFGGVSGAVFLALTAGFYHMYGYKFLHETYFYHLSRRDIRHNFSPYFYMIYLTADSWWSRGMGLAAFLPQVVLLLAASWTFHRDLAFTCFINTAIFVSFNKVCTSQYFLWYLCLLPVVIPHLSLSLGRGLVLLLLWFAGQGIWLAPAYFLEFEGYNSFLLIWLTGLIFLMINCFIMIQIICHYKPTQKLKAD